MSGVSKACPSILAFHKLLNQFSYSATNYSPRRFAELLRILTLSGHPPAPGTDEGLYEGRGVVFTFDDAYQHLETVLPPLMDQFGFRPLVFVPTALIGKSNRWDYSYHLRPSSHLDRDGLCRLSNIGVIFGSHGATHTDLTQCSPARLKNELADSRKTLQDLTGQEIGSVSYPFGRYDPAVLDAAKEAGFATGFSMRFPRLDDQPLARGRYPVYGFDTPWTVRQKLERGPLYRIEQFKAATVGRLSSGTILLNRMRHQPEDLGGTDV